jgi:hypothetical protein
MLKKNYKFYRKPHTTQERRENGRKNKWGRAKRNKENLVTAYDDKYPTNQKSWKVRRHKQYRENRGRQNSIFLPKDKNFFWGNMYRLENWFDEHDIPFRIERVFEKQQVIGYYLIWWSDKDIGIDYLLKEFYKR